MTTKTKWLEFIEVPVAVGRKTKAWRVVNHSDLSYLGNVAWRGAWRQYVFLPADGTLFNRTCLTDLAEFCNQRTKEQLAR